MDFQAGGEEAVLLPERHGCFVCSLAPRIFIGRYIFPGSLIPLRVISMNRQKKC